MWSDNSTWSRARVIAPRQQSWSFRTSYQEFDSRFGSDGSAQPLGQPFNRNWTWKLVLAAAKTPAEKQGLQNKMQQMGIQPSDVAAETTFDLKRQETTFDIAWAYGLSSHWMIGIEVPISLVDTQLVPNTAVSPTLASTVSGAQQRALTQNQLAAQGYDPVPSRTQNMIVGDIAVMSQVALWQEPDWVLSLQQMARIPSAPEDNVADYIRYSRGDGQLDFGMTALFDHQWRRFLFGAKIGYLVPVPDTQRMRVASTDNEDGPAVVDTRVHRNIGNLMTTSFETFYRLSRRWTANVAYFGFFKATDHYTGDAPSADYTGLGQDTGEELHLARAGFSYVLGTPSSRDNIENKWITNLSYYQPLAGRNVSQGPMAALELQTFF